MSLAISLRSEYLKTKRSLTWILTVAMAAFAPFFMLLVFQEEVDGHVSDNVARMSKGAWDFYFYQGTGMISFVFLPMFVILMSTLLPQIEYKNHTWKQVFAAPQSYSKLYFSKFIIFQLFILAFILIGCFFTGVSGVISNYLNPKFNFFAHNLDWLNLWKMVSKAYISILALSTFQFWMGMRFKSFLVPIGVGVLFYILGMINMIGYKVIAADKFFFNFSGFIFIKENAASVPFVLWISVAYAVGILIIGLIDFIRIKER